MVTQLVTSGANECRLGMGKDTALPGLTEAGLYKNGRVSTELTQMVGLVYHVTTQPTGNNYA